MPTIVYGNEVPSHTCILEWFKDSKLDIRTAEMIQGVGGHQQLKIQKQLERFMNW
jgi:hypothetical protein